MHIPKSLLVDPRDLSFKACIRDMCIVYAMDDTSLTHVQLIIFYSKGKYVGY